MPRKYKMYARIKYLHKEGFYVMGVSYLGLSNKEGWLDYARSKETSKTASQEEKFTNVTEAEYYKCKKFLAEIAKRKKENSQDYSSRYN
jgi:hypothetical protein